METSRYMSNQWMKKQSIGEIVTTIFLWKSPHTRKTRKILNLDLACLNHLNLHLMYLIKCIKTISQQRQIFFCFFFRFS